MVLAPTFLCALVSHIESCVGKLSESEFKAPIQDLRAYAKTRKRKDLYTHPKPLDSLNANFCRLHSFYLSSCRNPQAQVLHGPCTKQATQHSNIVGSSI